MQIMKEKFQEQLAQARRNLILDAAIVVIAEHGFQRTTIKQIAQMAEIADGTIYNYFENKDAILLGIVERITEAESREMHFAEAEKIGFEEFVNHYVIHRMKEVDAGFQVLKAILPETMINPELSRMVNERIYTPSFVVAERYFQTLMNSGEIEQSDPVVQARLFASPLLGLLFLRLLGDEHVSNNWQTYADAMSSFLLSASRKSGEKDEK